MDSGRNELNSSERIRWGDASRVYTRKGKRKAAFITADDDGATNAATTTTTAVPQVGNSNEDSQKQGSVDVPEPIRQILESEEAKLPEQQEHPEAPRQEQEVSESHNSLTRNSTRDGGDGDEHAVVPNGGEIQDGGIGPVVEPDGSIGCQPVVQVNHIDEPDGRIVVVPDNHIDEPLSVHWVETEVVKPVISRVEDRVRIDFSGASSADEIRDLRKKLESELSQVRDLVNRLETSELQLTAYDNNNNNSVDVSVTGSVGAVAGDFGAYGRPQYPLSCVIKNRSLVRVNSEISSVGHQNVRPFRPPSVIVTENNHGLSDLVEKEKRTPKANQYYTNSEFLLGKDRLPPESNKKLKTNGARKKHGGQSEHGFGFSFGSYKHKNQAFRNCSALLQKLMKHNYGWVFNNPVDTDALGLHDYHEVIKHPMDLGTIKTRLSQNWYKSPREFAEDVRLVFRNAMTYNPKGQDVHIMAEQMSKIFEEKWVVIEADYNPNWKLQVYHDSDLSTPTSRKVATPTFVPSPVPASVLTPQMRTFDRSESIARAADAKTKPSFPCRTPVPKKPKAKDANKRDMTYEEKQKLSTNLQGLPSDRLDAIVQIIKKRNSSLAQHDDEIEVDIDSVDAETLWELDRFVTNYKKSLSKNRKKAEIKQARAAQAALATTPLPVVTESQNENRNGGTNNCPTTCPVPPAQGDRQVDNAIRSSSSSSSSSDSGSSSSDSDSDSSSASGSDAAHSPRS